MINCMTMKGLRLDKAVGLPRVENDRRSARVARIPSLTMYLSGGLAYLKSNGGIVNRADPDNDTSPVPGASVFPTIAAMPGTSIPSIRCPAAGTISDHTFAPGFTAEAWTFVSAHYMDARAEPQQIVAPRPAVPSGTPDLLAPNIGWNPSGTFKIWKGRLETEVVTHGDASQYSDQIVVVMATFSLAMGYSLWRNGVRVANAAAFGAMGQTSVGLFGTFGGYIGDQLLFSADLSAPGNEASLAAVNDKLLFKYGLA
ncbi:hypothetical protein [Oceaniglobus trochenteri]|uniref:hypothetical protein n=1 Tax=Oceaniglobus trochenteri TaxID=2763260 RepID=UPI001CFF813F|nr:hypothetical protein [Oceaniglobus trochenteri]